MAKRKLKPKAKPMNLKEAEAFRKKLKKRTERERDRREKAEDKMYADLEKHPILPRRIRRRV